jgi:O-antigen/teichoic acid export membrane protein
MAFPDRQRIARFAWNASRYALGPLGGLLVPWLVIQRSDVHLWGQVVTPMIIVQFSVHLLAWGNRDFLLRGFGKPGANVEELWRTNYLTRAPFVALLLVPLLLMPHGTSLRAWILLWGSSLFISNSVEALIIQRKRFLGAFFADLSGLTVQAALILAPATVELSSVCGSFAIGQAVRAVLLVIVSGADPWVIFTLRGMLVEWGSRFRSQIIAAIPFFLIGVSGLLGSRMDLYMVNLLAGREQAGMYQVVSGLFLQYQVLPGLIVMPIARELYRLDRSSMWRASGRLARLGGILIIPFMLIAWSLFSLVFHFELSWTIYLAGALATFPSYGYVPLINLLFKHHQERTVMWASFLAAGVMVLLTIALVPRLGVSGGLFAAAAGQWSILLVLVRSVRRWGYLGRT